MQAIAIASPKASWAVVDEVGTILPKPPLSMRALNISDQIFIKKLRSFFEVTPINLIYLFLKYIELYFNSSLVHYYLLK